MIAPDFRGLIFLAVGGMICIPLVAGWSIYKIVLGIIWLCHHIHFT